MMTRSVFRRVWCGIGALCALASAGCELQEITLATPQDIIVAEVYVHAGDTVQFAMLHRTAGTGAPQDVPGATITVREDGSGRTLTYAEAHDSLCVRIRLNESARGTCYRARVPANAILPATRYTLRIEVDGNVLSGATTVPGTFRLVNPAAPVCELAARRPLELRWTQSQGAWVYVTDASFVGLRTALREEGVPVPGSGPVEMVGLSISGADTTLVFPTEIGLFNRFDDEAHAILLAINSGLPPGVTTDVVVAAGDRNYVNWVRGSAFNPSGQVRVPSIQGDGTGVFGAITPVRARLLTTGSGTPACDTEQTLQLAG